ncbi:MAG: calcium/sodium antiporter [Acidimicrobiales bacterium]
MPAALIAVGAGLVLLGRAADQFVVGGARLAATLRVSPVVIGAVVVGFGTSAPELLISGLAAGQGHLDLAVGNIVGSNIANVTLVLGVAGLIVSIRVDSRALRREAPLAALAVILFALLARGGLTRLEGLALGAVLVTVLATVIVDAGRRGNRQLESDVEDYLRRPEIGTRTEVLRTLLGLVGTLIGAQLMVWGAERVADELGLAEGFVGLTLVAVGTSLPELATAVFAARRGEDDLIVGNLLGSNIFNSLAVGATAAFAGPAALADPAVVRTGSIVMVVVMLAGWGFMMTRHRIERWEALTLLTGYVVFVPLLAS